MLQQETTARGRDGKSSSHQQYEIQISMGGGYHRKNKKNNGENRFGS
jgi:hypothetical protein